jgi:hypothetical protein
MPRVRRVLSWFKKDDDRLVGVVPLVGVRTNFLRRLLGLSQDEPMYDSFPLTPRQLTRLAPHVKTALDPEQYDYFVECEAVTAPQPARARS